MTSSRFAFACVVAGLAFHAGCTDTESATNLNPAGPPMIEQVILSEAQIDMSGNENDNRVFAFGTLPGLDPSIEHSVSSATVTGQKLRVVFDELLYGNALEEISCRANVGPDGAFDRVPIGATPDDIASCSTAQDVLKDTCTGSHAVCLCQLAAGCTVDGTTIIPMGSPVGVLDVNQDGAADAHRFIPTSVTLKCGALSIMPDPALSYWYPSGDQQVPAAGGVEAIGPAIVFIPKGGMPTNLTCNLAFDPSVTDKSGIQICAPQGGRTTACSGNLDKCQQDCTPGDVSAFSFKTAPIALSINFDLMGTDPTQPLSLQANTLLDTSTLAGSVSMTQGNTPFNAFTVSSTMANGKTLISITPTAGMWASSTTYTLTFSTALKDTFGSPLPQPLVITFTTGA